MFDNSNPYTFRVENIEGIQHYYVSFCDGQAACRETEVSRAVYLEMSCCFVRKERNLRRSDERHVEQSDLTDESLQERAANPPAGVEETVILRDRAEKLKTAIGELPEIQRRRFLLYFVDGLTLEQIAQREGCSFRAIKYSTDGAKEKIKKYFKE